MPAIRILASFAFILLMRIGLAQGGIDHIDDVLTIEWHDKSVLPEEGKIVFEGGVIARYGPTVLRADRIEITTKGTVRRALAEGGVRIEDPDGKASLDRFDFDWVQRTGSALGIRLEADGVHLEAKSAELKPGEWILTDVLASPDRTLRPFAVRSARVVMKPGSSGIARKISVSLFGQKFVTLPSYRFGARNEDQLLRLPSISTNNGIGIAWRSAYSLDDRTRARGSIRAKRGEGSGIALELARSLLPRDEPGGVISPISDLAERFTYGYFDNIDVAGPPQERERLEARRSVIAIGTIVNQPPSARLNDDLLSKNFEITLEQSRAFGGSSFYSAFRFEDIRDEEGLSERRLTANVATLLPSKKLLPGLYTQCRFDTAGFAGDRSTFAWTQAQIGLVAEPFAGIRLGAAMVRASEFGKPTFGADRLFSRYGYHVRLDANFENFSISALSKYDAGFRKWFDNEFQVSVRLGSVRPFVGYREFPRSFVFGVKLQAERTVERIGKRLNGSKGR